MKKVITSMLASVAVVAAAGAAQAQTYSVNPAGTGYTLGGAMTLQQTLPFPVSCPLNTIPFKVNSLPAAGGRTAQTTATTPYLLCSSGLAASVQLLNNWTISVVSKTGTTNNVVISGVYVKTLGANSYCGSLSQTINGSFVDGSTNITIPNQTIPGTVNGGVVNCTLGGTPVSSVALSSTAP